MAINTREKRAAALSTGWPGLTLPAPDGAIAAADRAMLVGVYPFDALTAPATKGVIVVQPSSTAASGFPFSVQPTVQLQDANSQTVLSAGVNVVASLATGTGVLGGTLTVATDATGLATFTDLKITGSGSHTITFTPTSLTAATSNAIVVAAIAGTSASLRASRRRRR